jgi:peptidoglycan/LPS O-acetylase OafA/YrhL
MERIPVLDIARIVASQIVMIGHLRIQMLPDHELIGEAPLWSKAVAFVAGFQGAAVIIFFVVSGWQVGGRFLRTDMEQTDILQYLTDRVSRLWTVLIPLLVLSALLGAAGVLPAWVPLGPTAFVANLFGLQTLLVPNYAGNSPLWSLANETFYYLLLPAIVALASRRAVLIFFSAAIFAIYLSIGTASLWLYALIWFTGALFSFVTIRPDRFAYATAAFCIALLVHRMFRLDEVFLAEWGYAILFCIMVSSGRRVKWPDRPVMFFQRYTFSLYVLHVPLMLMLFEALPDKKALDQLPSLTRLALFGAIVLIINLAAYLFYLSFEQHYVKVRRWIKARTAGRAASAP